jgi:hypothetical protein
MTSSDPGIELAEISDADRLTEFINRENSAAKPLSESYLKWWFFNTTYGDSTISFSTEQQVISGMACTRNFLLNYGDHIVQMAMPQKVLTAKNLRKKGLFSRLYFATEYANAEKQTVIQLTITNAASTPIFLNKFGYQRGISPDIMVIPTPLFLLQASGYTEKQPAEVVLPVNLPAYKNAILKDANYFKWRYLEYDDPATIIWQDKSGDNFVFLKIKSFKKIPAAFLLDSTFELNATELKAICGKLARMGVALLVLLNPHAGKNKLPIHFRIRNRFNFLVKGQNESATSALAGTKFRLSFGELDFV